MLYPMKLQPCYKTYLWGGTRLKRDFGKHDAPDITAESWELSCHGDGLSIVAEGIYAGRSVAELGKRKRQVIWGSKCQNASFPLLVKMIDAQKPLSIQVHPSDQTACYEAGERGKAEMWYIIDCEPHASIYLGFSQRISKDELLQRAKDGSICEVLNRVPVSKGDVFYILPGTIHAIGAGIVIAEIQQNSNTTFRVYDYQRRGNDGRLRPLCLERASSVMRYEPVVPEECKANSIASFPEFTLTEMFSCQYFRAYRVDIRKKIKLLCDGQSFQHLLCVDGAGIIDSHGRRYAFRCGESFLMPAALGEYSIEGTCRVLLSRV